MERDIKLQLFQSYIQKCVLLQDTTRQEQSSYDWYCSKFAIDIANQIVINRIKEYEQYLLDNCIR